jgi:hypothetical protein
VTVADDRDIDFEVRLMVETVLRLRELLNGKRCVLCAREISAERQASITLFDLAVCVDPICTAIVLDAPIHELTDIDEKEQA